MEDIRKVFGKHLRKIRIEQKPTQEELADKTGLHRAYFWDIENGRNISIKTAYRIARAIEVTLSDFFTF